VYQKIRIMKTCLDGIQIKVEIGNYLSSSFIENGLNNKIIIMCFKVILIPQITKKN
jgi:hypothetical protein